MTPSPDPRLALAHQQLDTINLVRQALNKRDGGSRYIVILPGTINTEVATSTLLAMTTELLANTFTHTQQNAILDAFADQIATSLAAKESK